MYLKNKNEFISIFIVLATNVYFHSTRYISIQIYMLFYKIFIKNITNYF